MQKFTVQSLTQLALVGGSVVIFMTTLVTHSGFRGLINMEAGKQGVRLTIDSRQLVDGVEPPKLEASKKN